MPEPSPETTLVLIKPDGVRRGLSGEIVARFERKGLQLAAARLLLVSRTTAEKHYAEHRDKPFYPDLVSYLTSGPVLALAVRGRSAIGVVRRMIGATDPAMAAPGTIRGDYGLAMTPNLVHASDSPASATREFGLFFAPADEVEYARTGAEYF